MTMTSARGFTPAQYRPSPIEAFAHNPLIEALPPVLSDNEWIKTVKITPTVTQEQRALPAEQRLLALVDLERFNYPLPESLDFARCVEAALVRGYTTKNPCLATDTHYLHYLDPNETPVQPSTGRFEPRPTGITLVGPSGTGKTRMIDRVLGHFPQVIQHQSYQGHTLPLTQVLWLKFDCPEDQSLVTFTSHFLSALDDQVGTEYFEETFKSRFINKGILKQKVIRLARTFRIGLIVLDEFSNLKLPRSATPANVPTLLRLILNLMNGSGVPCIFSGNPEMLDVLQLSLKTARRAENGGVIEMAPLHQDVWRALSKRLWTLQLTRQVTPWSEEGSRHLYDASRGLVEIAVRGFFLAQRAVIGSDDERLTEAVLSAGAMEAIRISNNVLDWSVQQNRVDSHWVPSAPPQAFDADSTSTAKPRARTKTTKSKARSRKGVCDPRRIQHPEFKSAIETLREEGSLIPDQVKPSLLRNAYGGDDLIQALAESGLLLVDPLEMGLSN